ncbi:hypothetical protein BC2230_30904 [Burkholderia cepacia]
MAPDGFHATSAAAICKAAGMNPDNVRHYFRQGGDYRGHRAGGIQAKRASRDVVDDHLADVEAAVSMDVT